MTEGWRSVKWELKSNGEKGEAGSIGRWVSVFRDRVKGQPDNVTTTPPALHLRDVREEAMCVSVSWG